MNEINEANILVTESPSDQAELAASLFAAYSRTTLMGKEFFDVVLSGGSSPIPFYRYLATKCKESIDWQHIRFFWGDERDVPPEHVESNFRMADETLLRPLGIPEKNIFRIQAGVMPATDAADVYEKVLKGVFGTSPQFDYLVLGLGEDGHVASLFPDSPEGGEGSWRSVAEQGHWVAAPWVPHLHAHRITLVPEVLNQGAKICFIVSGAGKANILADVLRSAQKDRYPAQLIHSRFGKPLWLLDRAAASRLYASQAA